jgi:hypothetical protein
MNQIRGFASSVVAKDKLGQDEFYVLGGYDRSDGFLLSVELYKNGIWTTKDNMSLPDGKSHFCTVFVQVRI